MREFSFGPLGMATLVCSAVLASGGTSIAADAAPARVELQVPADAEVWIGDATTQQKGMIRSFASPPLETGKTYGYDIRARWMQDGKPMDMKKHVQVTAGQVVRINFMTDAQPMPTAGGQPTTPAATAGTAPAQPATAPAANPAEGTPNPIQTPAAGQSIPPAPSGQNK